MLPRVHMVGNLVADPELRFSASGKAVAKLRVASNENRKQADGTWGDGPSCFLDVTAFDHIAEAVAEECFKGTRVIVEGRLQQREWETNAGEKRTGYEVLAEDIGKVLRGKKSGNGKAKADDPWASAVPSDEPPF